MILTALENARFYARVHPRIARALEYLSSMEWKENALGSYELENGALYVNVQQYPTISAANARWEAHQVYTDIQYIISGTERIGSGDISSFSPLTHYDFDQDVTFFAGTGNFFTVNAGMIAIFFPHDVHAPRIIAHEPMTVEKIVLKVRID